MFRTAKFLIRVDPLQFMIFLTDDHKAYFSLSFMTNAMTPKTVPLKQSDLNLERSIHPWHLLLCFHQKSAVVVLKSFMDTRLKDILAG